MMVRKRRKDDQFVGQGFSPANGNPKGLPYISFSARL
jgi:hypothetical protein